MASYHEPKINRVAEYTLASYLLRNAGIATTETQESSSLHEPPERPRKSIPNTKLSIPSLKPITYRLPQLNPTLPSHPLLNHPQPPSKLVTPVNRMIVP